jgi:hypothetical protein
MVLACLLMLFFRVIMSVFFSDNEMDDPFTLWQKVLMLQQMEHILNIGL